MKFTVLTLFPEMVEQGLYTSILGRAIDKQIIDLRTINIRDYTTESHGRVDDYTYGGGAGMLMQAQPVYDAWKAATEGRSCRTIYVTPQGRTFNQRMAAELAREDELVILCGHYEGIDERVLDTVVTDYVSIGDYILTGGELPAMVLIDVIARLVPGVLHNDESAFTESFHRDLLEYPQYSRPEEWNGMRVPEILLTGDHKRIEAWRLEKSCILTRERRPDLYRKYCQKEALIRKLSDDKRHNIHLIESLRRGRAEILYHQEDHLLLYDADANLYLISGPKDPAGDQNRSEAAQLIAQIQGKIPDALHIIISRSDWLMPLEERFGPFAVAECLQACYTQRCPLPVRHKEIRLLDETASDFVTEHCSGEAPAYLSERLAAGALYGIFESGTLAGFIGIHKSGSLGMLYIDKTYRRRGYATSLEAYCINRQLEQGLTPYLQIPVKNKAMLALQEKSGLYLSKKSLWELKKNL